MSDPSPSPPVKGGVRATLAMILAVISMALSIYAVAIQKTNPSLKDKYEKLQHTLDEMKRESSEQLNALRNETAKVLQQMSEAVREKESNPIPKK